LFWVYPTFYPLGTGGKANRPDADHSSGVEVKNAWTYTSTKPYIFMAWCEINEALIYLDLYINFMHIDARCKRKNGKKYVQ
jgi:hypothetical protein